MAMMKRSTLEPVLLAYHLGQIDGNAMLKATMPRWQSLAGFVYRCWGKRLPTWVEPDDILQVTCEAVLRFARTYDASRGAGIGWYVVENARDKAVKAVHKWRGARLDGNAGSHPSRFEIPMSVFKELGEPRKQPKEEVFNARQYEHVEAKQFFESEIAESVTLPQAIALSALRASGGSLFHAVDILFGNPETRRHCDLLDETDAELLLKRTMRELSSRYATQP